jgi:hypothetical protein
VFLGFGFLNWSHLVTCFEKPLFYRLLGVKFEDILKVLLVNFFSRLLNFLVVPFPWLSVNGLSAFAFILVTSDKLF